MVFLNKTMAFLKKRCNIIAVGLVVICGLCIATWFGYSSLSKLDSRAEYRIINDEYSVQTADINEQTKITQKFWISASDKLYGVRIKFLNNGAQNGTVTARLYDCLSGELVGERSVKANEIANDDFTSFFFKSAVEASRRTQFELRVSSSSVDLGMLSLWKSENSKPGFELFENDKSVNGTIALQYATRHVTDGVGLFYWIFAIGISFVLGVLYWMIFIKKSKPENVFAVVALAVGMVFCFFTPQLAAPDEYVHYGTAYKYASNLLGKEAMGVNGKLLVRQCDVPKNEELFIKSHDYDPFAYTELAEGFNINKGSSETTVEVEARVASHVFSLVYMPQALGISIARILNLGYSYTLILGRLLNLISYIALAWGAIRLIPFGKSALMAVAIFPMSLQLAGSLSYDVSVNGLSFLFISLCMKFAYEDKSVSWKQMITIGIIGITLSPSKAVYIVLVALCLIIPKEKFISKKQALIQKSTVLGASAFAWGIYNLASVSLIFRANPAVAPVLQTAPRNEQILQVTQAGINAASEILPNGDSSLFFTVGYILTHVEQTISLVINTIHQNMALYIQGLVGGRLGEIIVTKVEISWVLTIAIIIGTLLCSIRSQKQKTILNGGRRVWSVFVFLGVAALVVFACITWTPANYSTIFGIQGRYFIPAIPLVLLALRNDTIVTTKSIKRPLWFALACLNVLVLYDAFSIICKR